MAQKFLVERLRPKPEVQCTVLEVRHTEGFGVTANVILINGTLKMGDTIVCAGLRGPIVSKARALIVPPSMQEIRDTSKKLQYTGYAKRARGAVALKISGKGLENVVPGSSVVVPTGRQNLEVVKAMVMGDIDDITRMVVPGGAGVCVNASTIGSLEALMEFLVTNGIPIRHIELGNVTNTDVYRAANASSVAYACILAFDVKVSRQTIATAEARGVVIICANIIYNLLDQWRAYAARTRLTLVKHLPFRLTPVEGFVIVCPSRNRSFIS